MVVFIMKKCITYFYVKLIKTFLKYDIEYLLYFQQTNNLRSNLHIIY